MTVEKLRRRVEDLEGSLREKGFRVLFQYPGEPEPEIPDDCDCLIFEFSDTGDDVEKTQTPDVN